MVVQQSSDGRVSALAARLDALSGVSAQADEPLARHTTFRIGGPADLFVEVAEEASVPFVVEACREAGLPLLVMGLGSNLLVPDAGVRGVVARFVGDLERVAVDGTTVEAGAGLALAKLARQTATAGLSGLEALSGFPSTVGGAVVMNAGCYGTEIVDVLESVRAVDSEGKWRRLGREDLGAGYRTTALQGRGWVVTSAVFGLAHGDAETALARIDELNGRRRESLPSGLPNAGSVFRNPPEDFAGRLVQEAGLKGERRGGARISPKHGNVIVNEGGATADDVLELMFAAYGEVSGRFGVRLEPELVLAGDLRRRWDDLVASD
jgi:UDP-N-acetylmuramate dehydrogenase